MSECLFLREDAYFEPLFNGWYAWPHLISPVQAARHTVNTHLRLMKSFLKNHQLHILAANESGMAGGEFLNCSEEQLSDIAALVRRTTENERDLIELSDAVSSLETLLRNHTSGESIDYLYAKIPAPLKGLVELSMDLEHRASWRLIEPLVYLTRLYKPELQSLSFGLLSRVKERPFVLSTPRLPDTNHLQLRVPFASPWIDEVFRAREIALPASRVEELFAQHEPAGGLAWGDLFTSEGPRRLHQPVLDSVRMQYLGHAGFLIETPDTTILVDPFVASRGAAYAEDVISYSELPDRIDYVCLTHNHQDHVSLESLLQLRYKTRQIIVPRNNGGTLADPSIRLMLRQLGFRAIDVEDLEEVAVPGGRIVSVPFLGEHGDLNIRAKAGWYFDLHGKRIYLGADSSNPDSSLFARLGEIFSDVDVFAIGMECVGAPYTWLYGALHSRVVSQAIKTSRRLNGSNAAQAFAMAQALRARSVLIYAMGMEPWYRYFMGLEYRENSRQLQEVNALVESCRAIGVEAQMLFGKKTIDLPLGAPVPRVPERQMVADRCDAQLREFLA